MAILEQPNTGRRVSVSTRHAVGRATSCPLRLDDPSVSAIHAVLEWREGEGWWLRDLGSRNGTFVDDQRVPPNHAVRLTPGSELRFGGTAQRWLLRDAGPPAAAALASTGVLRVAECDLLALPGADEPKLTVFRSGDTWLLEGAQTREPEIVRDGTQVRLGEIEWTLLLPDLLPDTKHLGHNSPVGDLSLSFHVSLDEEHVEIQVDGPGLSIRVDHRSHHYLLLTLARTRLADSTSVGVLVSDQGWIDRQELERMLRMDTEQLNLHVFRARKRFAELGIASAAGIVERRSGSNQLRIGAGQLRIERS